MNFCQAHWDELRGIIDKFGLTKFVADSGEQAADLLMKEVEGKSLVTEFDPLLAASTAMFNVASGYVGALNLIAAPLCPVCAIERYDWLEGAAYQSVLELLKRGLLTQEDQAEIDTKCRKLKPAEGGEI